MINTYQTSLAPPPVPPRLSRDHPVLIPQTLAPQGHRKPFLSLLACVVLLHFFLSIAGFIYLYSNKKLEKSLSETKARNYYSSVKQPDQNRVLAHMIVAQRPVKTSGYLQWDIKNSVLGGVRYFNQTLLTVEQPGYYLVYSRVTFSKAAARSPLKGEVKLRKDDKKKEVKTLMRAYCNLDGATRTMCTASQEEVVRLERGNQLGVWVEDLSLVNYDEAATTFGMYKLEGEPLRAAGR